MINPPLEHVRNRLHTSPHVQDRIWLPHTAVPKGKRLRTDVPVPCNLLVVNVLEFLVSKQQRIETLRLACPSTTEKITEFATVEPSNRWVFEVMCSCSLPELSVIPAMMS